MRREDFSIKVNAKGYLIMYKDISIGGAGVGREAKSPTGRAATKQMQDYIDMAERDIERLIAGKGAKHLRDAIYKIEHVSDIDIYTQDVKHFDKEFRIFYTKIWEATKEFKESNEKITSYHLHEATRIIDGMAQEIVLLRDMLDNKKREKGLVKKLRKILGYTYP